jgi:NAD(P)-binding Rossmann-like domain
VACACRRSYHKHRILRASSTARSACSLLCTDIISLNSKTFHLASLKMGNTSSSAESPQVAPHDSEQGIMDTVIENFRPMSVIVIGGGFSGIYCGVRIPQRLRNVKLTIYEKNAGVGGTWYENKYPGCACDIPGECDTIAKGIVVKLLTDQKHIPTSIPLLQTLIGAAFMHQHGKFENIWRVW